MKRKGQWKADSWKQMEGPYGVLLENIFNVDRILRLAVSKVLCSMLFCYM